MLNKTISGFIMKNKFLLSLWAVMTAFTTGKAEESDLSELTDAVYIQSTSIPAGSEQTLSIRMKNSMPVQTINFDLILPSELTIVRVNNKLISPSTERIVEFDTFKTSTQPDGSTRLLALAAYEEEDGTITNIAVGDGEIARVKVKVDAEATPGDYPIIVRNIQLVSRENEAINIDEVTTTITITEPGDGRTVLDENSETVPASATNVDVRVKRTINANQWSTIVLPFAMTEEQVKEAFGNDVQLADFIGTDPEFDSDNVVAVTANFTAVQAIEGNHPYIIKVSSPVSEFTLDGVDIVANEEEAYIEFDNGKTGSRREVYSGFYGTYHAQTVLEEFTLFLSENKFWYSTGLTKMKAFRAYFDFIDILTEVENGSANVKMFVNTDNDATGIHSLNADLNSNETIYNLAGQRVDKNYKGIVIENGKKIMR